MSIEEKIKAMDLLSDLFSRLKKISENEFIENYAKDQMRNVLTGNLAIKEEPSRISPLDYSESDKGIICTSIDYPTGYDIDSYLMTKPHSGMFFDINLKQFMFNMNGIILKGCLGKLVNKKSKKTMRCFSGVRCSRDNCPYYHIHDIEFIRGRHPSEIPGSDKDYVQRRMMHDFICNLFI